MFFFSKEKKKKKDWITSFSLKPIWLHLSVLCTRHLLMYFYLGFNKMSRITCLVKDQHQNKESQDLSHMKKKTFLISNADTKTPYETLDG